MKALRENPENSNILLDPRAIRRLMKTQGIEVEVFEQIPSTNDYFKPFFGVEGMRVCVAECQTQGRGRMQRHWHSPFGQNLYFSMLYPFNTNIAGLSGLSLVIGLAICRIINALCSLPKTVLMKWPNDVYYDGSKLGGCLIESQAQKDNVCSAIIGIGINVNMQDDESQHIDQPWTSIKQLNYKDNDRNVLCATLIDELVAHLTRFNADGLSAFMDEWQRHDALLNKTIRLSVAGKQCEGIAKGITPQGHLILVTRDGHEQHFTSGEATIKGAKADRRRRHEVAS